ncbi:TPA: phage tail sheath protein, partial [Clostridioides difficile]|nr:phage tail sheath protein [Clostridioides difficile]
IDISNMKEQEIREANTGSKVFLKAKIKMLDAMEDIDLSIEI